MSTQNRVPTTVTSFLAQLPPDRRAEMKRVREVVRRHLPAGYEEVVTQNMLLYQVPWRLGRRLRLK